MTILPVYTSKYQLNHVFINKPSKAVFRKGSVQYISRVLESFLNETNQNLKHKLSLSTYRHVEDRIEEGLSCKLMKTSFDVCGITREIWVKVYKNGPKKSCGRKPLKNFKLYCLLRQTISLQMFLKVVFRKFYLVHS